MQWSPRRALPPVLGVALVLTAAGCGGAGYGEPIAASDGGTVALAPAPVTTPGEAARATGDRTTATNGGRTTATNGGRATRPDAGSATEQPGSDGGGADTGGGGTSGGGGSGGGTAGTDVLAAYATDANRFCSGFKSATRALTTDIGSAGSNTRAVGRAIIAYGSAIENAATGLKAAPVPRDAATYNRRTLEWVAGVTSAIDDSRSGLAGGDASAGAAVVQRVQDLGGPPLGSDVPASLRARATACAS